MDAVNEPETVQALEVIPHDIQVARAPERVIDEARTAASALKKVLSEKKHKFMVRGEQYLQFEDWQTLGRFYGVTARIKFTQPVTFGDATGFEAAAEALRADGAVISAAEAMCMDDEPNWRGKPIYQLRSMAQTRACAKALRNVLSWVAVLAGYSGTPAEEMIDDGAPATHSPAPASDVPPCPDCGGPVWDNRKTKKGRQPDFKCKDRSCDKAVWLNSESKEARHKALIQGVSDAFKLLNQAGDVPVWTAKSANQWVAERFGGAEISSLEEVQINELLKMLTERHDKLKGGDRETIIAAIKSNFDSEEHLNNYLKDQYKGQKIEEMGLGELKALESDVAVPF